MTEEFKKTLASIGMTEAEWEIRCAENTQRTMEFCKTLADINKMPPSNKIRYGNN